MTLPEARWPGRPRGLLLGLTCPAAGLPRLGRLLQHRRQVLGSDELTRVQLREGPRATHCHGKGSGRLGIRDINDHEAIAIAKQ